MINRILDWYLKICLSFIIHYISNNVLILKHSYSLFFSRFAKNKKVQNMIYFRYEYDIFLKRNDIYWIFFLMPRFD